MAQKLKLLLVSFLLAFMISFGILWSYAQRAVSVAILKEEIVKLQNSLNEVGYDLAYENLSFSQSPFYLAKISDFKIYSLDENNYYEWHVPELKINAGLFDIGHITLKMSANQYLQTPGQTYITDFPVLKIGLDFDPKDGLKNLTLIGKNLSVENLGTIGEIKIASQRMAPKELNDFSPFFENYVELKSIRFADNIHLPTAQEIDRVYANLNIIGLLKKEETYKQSIMSWLTRGGIIDVQKFVLNYDYLNLVGRGDLYFNENMEPNLHLTASSKGLLEFIQTWQDLGVLDNKGVFVVKILLNAKAFRINKNDIYQTVTTSINASPDSLNVENIPLMKF